MTESGKHGRTCSSGSESVNNYVANPCATATVVHVHPIAARDVAVLNLNEKPPSEEEINESPHFDHGVTSALAAIPRAQVEAVLNLNENHPSAKEINELAGSDDGVTSAAAAISRAQVEGSSTVTKAKKRKGTLLEMFKRFFKKNKKEEDDDGGDK